MPTRTQHHPRTLRVGMAALTMILAACSNSDSDASTDDALSGVTVTVAPDITLTPPTSAAAATTTTIEQAQVAEGSDISIPDVVSLAMLDRARLAYIDCLDDDLSGQFMARMDRYLGFQLDVGLPDGRDDPALIDEKMQACSASTGFEDLDFAYRQSTRLPDADLQAVADEMAACLPGYDGEVQLASAADIADVVKEMTAVAGSDGRAALFECFDHVIYGDPIEFG